MELSFKKNIVITGTIVTKTGMHIGGNKGELIIGGTDSPVISDKEGNPYIPGSSLKGKLRTMLELSLNKSSKGEVHKCDNSNCAICRVFGSSEGDRGPTRLVVRDSQLIGGPIETELKTENVINRLTGRAEHPRTMERVPADTHFQFEMVFGIYDDSDYDYLKTVFELLEMLKDTYLGGSGSRGYGKVLVEDISVMVRSLEDYKQGSLGRKISLLGKEKASPIDILVGFEAFKRDLMS